MKQWDKESSLFSLRILNETVQSISVCPIRWNTARQHCTIQRVKLYKLSSNI